MLFGSEVIQDLNSTLLAGHSIYYVYISYIYDGVHDENISATKVDRETIWFFFLCKEIPIKIIKTFEFQ